jgi:HSP20 family protein
MRRMTDELERQLAAWGIDNSWISRPFGSSLLSKEMAEPALWAPSLEIVQRNGSFTVRADVPGAIKDDLSIEVIDDRLVLRGERRREEKEEKEGYLRSERVYGSFYRSIPLPEGADPDSAHAELKDGVLEVTMKAPEPKTTAKKIDIA